VAWRQDFSSRLSILDPRDPGIIVRVEPNNIFDALLNGPMRVRMGPLPEPDRSVDPPEVAVEPTG
jgi:hypothetical protein